MKSKLLKITAIVLGLFVGIYISSITNDSTGIIYGSIGIASLFYTLIVKIFKLPKTPPTNLFLRRILIAKWVFVIVGVLYIISGFRTITGL